MKIIKLVVPLMCALLMSCDAVQFQESGASPAKHSSSIGGESKQADGAMLQKFEMVPLLEDLELPWGMDFLPDGRLLITEKAGRLRIFDIESKNSEMIDNIPEVYFQRQGGLLDVVVHPDHTDNQWLYLSYSAALGDGKNTTRVTRYRLADNALVDANPIFEAEPGIDSSLHFGSALLFDNAGYLYITVGDRGDRYLAQDLAKHMGKVLRLRDDGSVPHDNPFVDHRNALPEIYSYGHRNPQGITIDRKTNRVWVVEHGPQGGDEINLLQAGANYGWPVITYGEEYGGGKIGKGTQKQGMQQPVFYYVPSIATAGMTWYDHPALPGWQQSLFVAGLRSLSVSRVALDSNSVKREERLFEDFKFRSRDLIAGPEGYLYLLAENGGLQQIRPAAK